MSHMQKWERDLLYKSSSPDLAEMNTQETIQDITMLSKLYEASYLNAIIDMQNVISYSSTMRVQQSLTSQILNIFGYCSWIGEDTYYQSSPHHALNSISQKLWDINDLNLAGFAFPNIGRDTSPQILYSRKIAMEATSEPVGGVSEHPLSKSEEIVEAQSGHEDSQSDHNGEEQNDDNHLLETHPFEVKYILNKKTNRKLKRMVCMFDGCGKIFEKKWNFKDHIRMHKGDTPYQCSKCEKSFTQRGNLVKHERQHLYKSLKARKVHKCHICVKAFTEKYNLKVSKLAVLFLVKSKSLWI